MSAGNASSARARRAAFASLVDPLEAVKQRDAAEFAAVQARLLAAESQLAALQAAIAKAEAAFDPADLQAAAAFYAWRGATLRRIAAAEAARDAIRPDWEAARETLLRSNGDAQAAQRLSGTRPKKA